jgi:hypothetical protein
VREGAVRERLSADSRAREKGGIKREGWGIVAGREKERDSERKGESRDVYACE